MSTKIMDTSKCKTEQMTKFLLQNNSNPNINCTVDELVRYYIEEGNIEGVRGDIAFAQSIIETGYFKFGGIVLPSQNNFCGLGALNGNGKGGAATFESPRIGIRAQIQHLKAYGSKNSLKLQCVDPRYNLVTKGIAPNVEDLAGRWAVPGYDKNIYSDFKSAFAANATYGQKIMSIVNKILMVPINQPIKEIDTNIKDDKNSIVNNGKLNVSDKNLEENIFNDTNYDDNTIQENNVIPEDNVPKRYGNVEASTSGIIAAILDLLITFFTAWQSVDDEPIVEPINNDTSNEEVFDDSKFEEQENKETIFSKFKRKSKKSKKIKRY